MKRIILALFILLALSCRRETQRSNEVIASVETKLASDPGDPAWQKLPEYLARLLTQDLVEPRLMNPSTAEVRVRAMTAAREIAFRLEWADPVQDDLPGAGRFADACAIQTPGRIDPNPPDPQMGQEGRSVEISYWRADWQAWVNGRPDDITALFPNASVDRYPFDATPLEKGSAEQLEFARRYAPSAALGNRREGPRENPVEDLIAEGPGTLSPAAKAVSRGKGVFGPEGWSVVIIRPLPDGLAPAVRSQIAFAIWEGSKEEAGARKMRSAWIPLAVKEGK